MLAVWDCIPNCFQQHNKGFSFTGLIRQGEACFFRHSAIAASV